MDKNGFVASVSRRSRATIPHRGLAKKWQSEDPRNALNSRKTLCAPLCSLWLKTYLGGESKFAEIGDWFAGGGIEFAHGRFRVAGRIPRVIADK